MITMRVVKLYSYIDKIFILLLSFTIISYAINDLKITELYYKNKFQLLFIIYIIKMLTTKLSSTTNHQQSNPYN